MANVTVTVPTSNITVDTTNSIVNVASTSSNVTLSATAAVANADVREAISVSNVSGFGNLAYDSTSASNGIIQYTGVSTSDIRGQISATSPIIYNSSTGDISINSSAVFSGKTTDDLAQGTTNIYFSTSGATVNTDALPEGSSNEYYTDTRSRSAVSVTTATASGDGALVYDSGTGVFTFTPADSEATRYGNVQVADFLANGFGSNNITTTGIIDSTRVNSVRSNVATSVIIGDPVAGVSTANTFFNYGGQITGATLKLDGTWNAATIPQANIIMEGLSQNMISARTFAYEGAAQGNANLFISADRGITNFIHTDNNTADLDDNDVRFRVVTGVTPEQFSPSNADGYLVDIGANGSMIFDINPRDEGSDDGYFRVYSDRGPYTLGTPIFSVDPTAVNTEGTVTINGNTAINGNITGPVQSMELTGNIYSPTTTNFIALNEGRQFNWTNDVTTSAVGNVAVKINQNSDGGRHFSIVGASYTNDRLFTVHDGTNLSTIDTHGGTLQVNTIEASATVPAQSDPTLVSVAGNLSVSGNLEVTGNINYREVEDLLVQDQTITMNYGNATAQDAQIIVDRSGASGGTNVDIKWNETTDKWTFSNDGSTYFLLPTSTTDLAEGTNEYYTNAKARASISASNNPASGTGAISYDSATGILSYTPPVLPTGDITGVNAGNGLSGGGTSGDVTLTLDTASTTFTDGVKAPGVLNVNTAGSPSGGGSLTYTTGTFDFTPADIHNENEIVNGTSNVQIASADGNVTINVNGSGGVGLPDLATFSNNGGPVSELGEFTVQGNITAISNVTTGNAHITHSLYANVINCTNKGGSFGDPSGVRFNQLFTDANTSVETGNIDGDGYAIFGGSDFVDTAHMTYTNNGGGDLKFFEFEGSATSGSPNLTVTAIRQGDDDSAATVGDLNIGYSILGGTTIFPDEAYVTAINTGTGVVTMSKNAIATATLTYSSENTFTPALVDTDTGLVISVRSTLQATGSGSYTTIDDQFARNVAYGYPQRGPIPTDFNIVAVGSTSDYTVNNLKTFTVGRTNFTPANTVIKARSGITIGDKTDLTNRGENDVFRSFGLNMMWDGEGEQQTSSTDSIQPAILFKSYTDGTAANTIVNSGSGAPRLFFTTAKGKAGDDPFTVYPRAEQELGRLSFWGTTGTQLTPSSYNVPSYMSVQAADDWDTWGGGPAGNTNVYFGSTSSTSGNPDTYLAYKSGELILGAGNSKSITFAPASQTAGSSPQNAYTGQYTTWANVDYSNPGASKGAKLQVTNGGSDGVGVVGDMELSVFRNDITNGGSPNTVANNYYSGQSNYYSSIGATNPSATLIFGALFGTNVNLAGLVDGDLATFDNYTGTFGTEINGNSYYVKVLTGGAISNPFYANYGIGLFTDAALTTAATFTSGTGDYGQAGSITYTQPPTVTDREYKFKLEEQSEKLEFITVDGTPTSTTLIEYSEALTEFKNRVKLKSHTSAEILALTGMTAGEMVYNSTDNLVAYYDGTNWRNIAQGAIVT